jgi:hypothetical protein
VSVTANGGSILDGNDIVGETLNIQNNGNAVMYAQGTIGTVGNCIEVEIGGTLTASVSGGVGTGAINLCGTTNGGTVTILPFNGVLTLNGKPIDPAYILGLRYTPFYFWDIRRRYDKYAQYPLIDSMIFIPLPIEDERTQKEQ